MWEPDEDQHLTCTAAWVGEGPDLAEFERATHELRARAESGAARPGVAVAEARLGVGPQQRRELPAPGGRLPATYVAAWPSRC